MVKQEVLKVIAELREAQGKQDEFVEYYKDFCSVPRCKRGVVDFLLSLKQGERSDNPNVPWIFSDIEQELKVKLLSGKCSHNSWLLNRQLDDCTYMNWAAKDLRAKRQELFKKLGEYILHIHEQLGKSSFSDARERQVYLRRAIARLANITSSYPVTAVTAEQWSEVAPLEYIDYLNDGIEVLVEGFSYGEAPHEKYGSIWYDYYGLNKPLVVDSIVTYLDYLDSFLVY
jgi:hypothetical protein